MIVLLPVIAQELFVLTLVGMLAWLLWQPLPQGDDDPDHFSMNGVRNGRAEEVLPNALTVTEYQRLIRFHGEDD